MIEGVHLTPLRTIPGEMGDIMHAMKCTESTFSGFGEAYFSTIKDGAVKAWKRHRHMTLNLVVPCGRIKFVLWDDRPGSSTHAQFFETILSAENYQRLTVPPMVWMGFQGIGKGFNMLLNIADIPHDPQEADRLEINNDVIEYEWNEL